MNATRFFEVDGHIGKEAKAGKLIISKRVALRGSRHTRHYETEYFVSAEIYERLRRPASRRHIWIGGPQQIAKINPDKMSFYLRGNKFSLYPKGEPGRNFLISTAEIEKLEELKVALFQIRIGVTPETNNSSAWSVEGMKSRTKS